MAIVHENILKVLDIHYDQFSKAFIGMISTQQPTYKDRILEEDIFSPDNIREDTPEIPDQVAEQLREVEQLMQKWDCGYFRIIYS